MLSAVDGLLQLESVIIVEMPTGELDPARLLHCRRQFDEFFLHHDLTKYGLLYPFSNKLFYKMDIHIPNLLSIFHLL